jgi:hypothetical protein
MTPELTSDPVAPVDGEIWYNTTADALRCRINGVTYDLGVTGSGAPTTAPYVTISDDPGLSADRYLAGAQGVQVADGGAGGAATVSFRIENLTSDPGSPETGRIWLRTDL